MLDILFPCVTVKVPSMFMVRFITMYGPYLWINNSSIALTPFVFKTTFLIIDCVFLPGVPVINSFAESCRIFIPVLKIIRATRAPANGSTQRYPSILKNIPMLAALAENISFL